MSISFKIVARNMSCSDISIFLKKPGGVLKSMLTLNEAIIDVKEG